MRIAIYPGGFDPVTNGHLDLISRMTNADLRQGDCRRRSRPRTRHYDVHLGRADRAPADAASHLPTVEVEGFENMTVEFARQQGRRRDCSRHSRRQGLRVRVRYGADEPQDGARDSNRST